MGIAKAGKMTTKVLPSREGTLPVEANAETNTLFSKIRRVKGRGVSYLNSQNLRPIRYVENAVENEVHRSAEVNFGSHDHLVRVDYKIGDRQGHQQFRYANDGLDVVGAIYLMRQLPFSLGRKVCFDAYGIRRLWRVFGRVEGREHLSLPIGEFEAWHLSGLAVRLDDHQQRREVHVWISDDQRRLPLAAVASIDLGSVRAKLVAFSRPGERKVKTEGKEKLKW
jgi:hypothetical protein